MKNIKKQLIDASNEQQIHDLSNEIINKVDVRNVKKAPAVVISNTHKFGLFYKLGVVALGVAGIVLISFAIGKGINTNPTSPTGNQNLPSGLGPEPSGFEPQGPSGHEDSGIHNPFDITDISYDYLNEMEAQETYNLVNIASSLDKYTFNSVTVGETKYLTVSQEEALVNDLSCYLYNIEDMLGLKSKATCERSDNNINENYKDYQSDIKVSIPNQSEYHIYLNETIDDKRIKDELTYKLKTSYSGVIVCNDKEYVITGNMNYKDNVFTYITNLAIDENNYVNVKEEFKEKENDKSNIFTYNYCFNGEERIISVKQSRAGDSSTKKVSFSNGLAEGDWYTQIESFEHTDNHYLECKIKSYGNDYLYIDLNDGVYTYKFKKSNNQY